MTTTTDDAAALVGRLERFYDTVPRAGARAEHVGPFTVFVPERGDFPLYARPTPGAAVFTVADVAAVRDRQRVLGVPEAFEWQHEATPALAGVLRAAGLHVHDHPLQVLTGGLRAGRTPHGVVLRQLTPDDPDELYVVARAVAEVGFAHDGTGTGDAGLDARRTAADGISADAVDSTRRRVAAGDGHVVLALVDDEPVAVASSQLASGVAEIVGVATLPAFRRRGLGAAATACVVEAALGSGVDTVFLSAGDDDVARMYAALGFVRVGTAGIAEAR
ncbi:MAG: GNAT family N-acetyltransferase [Streptosporangiales bacterium]|nr:GNAT family N-acetyltransferase [Streptosporangiales bacterium]